MKTCDDIEIAPRQGLDHIAVNRCNFFRVVRKARIWFDTGHVKRIAGHPQKVAASTSDFEKSSRCPEILNQIESPLGIQDPQPMLFLQPEIPDVGVRRLDAAGNFSRIAVAGTKRQLGSPRTDISKSTYPALHQRSIELWRLEDGPGITSPANIAGNHERRRESVSFRFVYIRS